MLQPLLVSHYQQVYSKPVLASQAYNPLSHPSHTRMTTLGLTITAALCTCERYLGKENVTRLFSDSKPSNSKKKVLYLTI